MRRLLATCACTLMFAAADPIALPDIGDFEDFRAVSDGPDAPDSLDRDLNWDLDPNRPC